MDGLHAALVDGLISFPHLHSQECLKQPNLQIFPFFKRNMFLIFYNKLKCYAPMDLNVEVLIMSSRLMLIM